MENTELKLVTPDIEYTTGTIKFDNFELFKSQALMIAEFITHSEVCDENIKTTKKMLASSRKIVDELDKRRMGVKKSILTPYLEFESQINELKDIVNGADLVVRKQVKELEEQKRVLKKAEIKEIWDKRIDGYDAKTIPNLFDKWLTPQHLNKSMSMKKVEEDMVKFLEQRQVDLEALSTLDASVELMGDYFENLSLSETMTNYRERIERERLAEKALEVLEDNDEETQVFVVKGKKDIAMAKLLLDSNGIKYELGK